jgi:hypothetical protein
MNGKTLTMKKVRHRHSIYNEFFQLFDVTRRRVATFEEPVKKLGDARGFIDLFWRKAFYLSNRKAPDVI